MRLDGIASRLRDGWRGSNHSVRSRGGSAVVSVAAVEVGAAARTVDASAAIVAFTVVVVVPAIVCRRSGCRTGCSTSGRTGCSTSGRTGCGSDAGCSSGTGRSSQAGCGRRRIDPALSRRGRLQRGIRRRRRGASGACSQGSRYK
ncbi:hypothetical protein [Paenibacillus tyrfis]|uniref:hypothetical protein n=1 Tax=Paenibacillus tyrfis TaxID=1501230 RepID=UPI002492072D|nr:hypothetical protein [Paenibacillus tyrfis]